MSNDRSRRRRGTANTTGSIGSKSELADTPPLVADNNVVDLNSRSATYVANIVFRPVQQHSFPIIQFECHDCLRACQQIREWLESAGPPDIRPLIRVDDQELNLIGPHTKGSITLLEGAATLEGDPKFPISIFAMHIPKQKHIRYFWTLLSPSLLLTELAVHDLIGPPAIYADDQQRRRSPTGAVLPPRHHTFYTFLAQSFLSATTFPDSPAYRTASQLSDVCPSILDPSTAHRRIEASNELHTSHDPSTDGKDLGDDRYILEIHPAERALASLVHAYCAEYLLIKRQYFKAFSKETISHAEKVRRAAAQHQNEEERAATPAGTDDAEDDHEDNPSPADTPTSTPLTTRSRARSDSVTPALGGRRTSIHTARASAARTGARNRALRVRTKNMHFRTVEAQSGWNFARAKKLVLGWEILGFLDEERVLAVLMGDDDGEGSEGEW